MSLSLCLFMVHGLEEAGQPVDFVLTTSLQPRRKGDQSFLSEATLSGSSPFVCVALALTSRIISEFVGTMGGQLSNQSDPHIHIVIQKL